MDYWDSSALFKLYVPEPDTDWFLNYVASSTSPAYSSTISILELTSATYRKLREKKSPLTLAGVMQDFAHDAENGHIVQIPCGQDVLDQAQDVITRAARKAQSPMIRSLDAIHVASALVIGAKTMIATDTRVRAVASLSGLKLIPS